MPTAVGDEGRVADARRACSPVVWSESVMLDILVKLSVASRLLPRLVRRSPSMPRMLWVPLTRSGGTF